MEKTYIINDDNDNNYGGNKKGIALLSMEVNIMTWIQFIVSMGSSHDIAFWPTRDK
jgi:hypothetical protein